MAAKKGHEKLGGRQQGSKNKNTLILETFAQTIVEGGMEKFQHELNKLSGKDFINAYLALFEFVKPKLGRTEIKAEGNGSPFDIVIKVSSQTEAEAVAEV